MLSYDMPHLTCGISFLLRPSTSSCSLSSWFTSYCTHHLISVSVFALTIGHSPAFHSRLKLNSSLFKSCSRKAKKIQCSAT